MSERKYVCARIGRFTIRIEEEGAPDDGNYSVFLTALDAAINALMDINKEDK